MFEYIFHPSDFTETSQVAFNHALRIAAAARADLQLVHVSAKGEHTDFENFPGVRDQLERWHVLEEGSSRGAVVKLGMTVDKTIIRNQNPVAAIAGFLEEKPSSLVVLAAHQRPSSILPGHSKAEPIARQAAATTLFVPDGTSGFISAETGEIGLRNIVIPVTLDPSPTPTIESIRELVSTLGVETVTIHLVHVGSQATIPALPTDESDGIDFRFHPMEGDVVQAIIAKSSELDADLVAMTTAGHHGFLDAIRGSTTEQVLRGIQCPLWAVTAS